jgi:hypothetical protein
MNLSDVVINSERFILKKIFGWNETKLQIIAIILLIKVKINLLEKDINIKQI